LSFALADTKTIKGKMQNINMKDESFKLMTEDGKSIELKAPSIFMEDLKPGDEVLVTIDEGEVIAISLDKKEAD
jgi:translation elongation factor P/translation initiation factor 5A